MRHAAANRFALGVAIILLGGAAFAQTPDGIRAQVAGARLGAGYAQMINLSATPDLSAASYRVDAIDPAANLDVLHLPYESKWLALSPAADLYWKLSAGWLQLKQDFAVSLSPAGGGVDSKWTAYSGSAGLLVKYRLGNGFTVEPAIEAGIASLANDASYGGDAKPLQPLLDGVLFNWSTNAWLVTPSAALGWTAPLDDGKISLRGHVARSWIGSFDETDPVQRFDEAANIYSIRADYAHATGWTALGRPIDWVGSAGYVGFFCANRDAFGLDAVADVGAGLEAPIVAGRPGAQRARLTAACLFGRGVRGWTVGVSIRY